jgi:hypothetical protein
MLALHAAGIAFERKLPPIKRWRTARGPPAPALSGPR